MPDKTYGNISDAANAIAPADSAFDITGDDSTDLAHETRGLYVGTSGSIKVTLASGDTVTFNNLAKGIIHPIRAKRVWSTGLTAVGVIGLY